MQLTPLEFLTATDYWTVTDAEMKIDSYWDNLADAKDAAREFAIEWKRVAFVCDRRGLVVSGFGQERE